jgi:hypothetical protein
MSGMFQGATAFNQKLGAWNVSSVRDMRYMFAGALAFDQDISSWNISSARYMENMFTALSTANYDALLIGWSQKEVPPSVFFSVGSSQYSSGAKSAKDFLMNMLGWNIIDGGPNY